MYCEEVDLTGYNVLTVLYCAKKYMISGLEKICREYLEKQIEHVNIYLLYTIGGSGGGVPGARHPLWDPILLFSHTFSLKSARVGGPRPPMGNSGSATGRIKKLKIFKKETYKIDLQ